MPISIYLADDNDNFIVTDAEEKILIREYFNPAMIFPGTKDIDASQDAFFAMQNDNSSPWSIQADVSAVTGGTPSYTVMVSNISQDSAKMKAYRTEMSNVPLADIVSDAFLAFKYIGIQYTANGAAGTTTFYLEQNAVRTVLY